MKSIVVLQSCVLAMVAGNLFSQVDVPRFFNVVSNDAVTGSATLTKTGAGILWMQSASGNTFSGDITVDVDGGTLRIGGGAGEAKFALPNLTSANALAIRRGGIFYVEDSQAGLAGFVANRLGSAGQRPAVSLAGGTLALNGLGVAGTHATQTVSHVTAAQGPSTITVNRNNTLGTPKLIGESLTIAPGAFVQFVNAGTALGSAIDNVPQLLFNTPPTLIGGGGASGSKSMSILPRTRLGNDLVYYGAFGIRALVAAEYNDVAVNNINGAGATENVRISLAVPLVVPALAADKTVNSLTITPAANLTWAMGYKLTLTSGQLLSTALGTSRIISSGTLTAGSGEDLDLDLTILGNTTTIGANIADNGAGKVAMVKNGVGTLTLNPATDNTYSGGTFINEGALATVGATADRRFFGTGPVRADNTTLTLTAIGSTANSSGDDYTAVNGAQIYLPTLAFTSADTFNIGAGSVISAGVATGTGLNSLDRAANITLAAGAVIAHPSLATTLNLGTATIKNLGTAADLYYGLYADQVTAAGNITVGSGTAFKGVSSDRSGRRWSLGTIQVAPGTSEFNLLGLTIPGTTPATLTLGNGLTTGLPTAGAPVVNLAGNGAVDAQVLGFVTLDDNLAVYGNTAVGDVLNFVVNPGATLTVNPLASLGSGTGIATARVRAGGSLTLGGATTLNGAITIEAGGRLNANNGLGMIGSGIPTMDNGALIDVTHAYGFSGSQADAIAASLSPGTLVRLSVASFGSTTDTLDSRLASISPIYEIFGADRAAANPLALGTTIMTLNRDGSGVGGMLVNDHMTRSLTATANGLLVIGPNGGTIAATRGTVLAVAQPIALGANELTIGATNRIDGIQSPKLGAVTLSAAAGYNTASAGSKITVVPGALLNNAANALPDLTEMAVAGAFYVAGADIVGSLSGTGLVTVASGALTVGRNNAGTVFSGVLAGAQPFNKTGAGRQDLTGNNTRLIHTGAINVNEGTLALSGAGKFSNSTGAITINTNGTLLLDNTDALTTGRIGTKAITLAGGTLGLLGNGAAATTETVGAVTPGQGDSTIRVSGGTSGKANTLVLTAGGTRANGATLHFEGLDANNIIKYTTAQAGAVGGILPFGFVGNDFAVVVNNTPITAYSAYTTGDLGAYAGGTANFSLSGTQTACTTTKAVNSVKMTNGLGIAVSAGTLTFTSGAIINDGGGDITGAGTIAAGTAVWTILNTGNMTISSAMTGTGGLVKLGAGRLTIGSATAFSGNTTITGGTLAYGIDEALFTQDIYVDGGATLDFGAYNDANLGSVFVKNGRIIATGATAANSITQAASKNITLGGGPSGSSASIDTGLGKWKLSPTAATTVTYSEANDPGKATIAGKLDLNSAAHSFAVGNSLGADTAIDLDIPAAISGTANLTKTGLGTLRLGGANTFDGTLTLSAGTVILANSAALGSPSMTRQVAVASGGTLALDGGIAISSAYNTLSLNAAGNPLLGPVSGALVSLSGNNSIAGAVSLAAGSQIASLKVGDKLTLGGNMTAVNFNLTAAGDGDIELGGVLALGSGTLSKNGAGTLTLKGGNTFTGTVAINAGALNVQHSTGLGTIAGNVAVYIGGSLQLQGGVAVGAEALTLLGAGVAGDGALRNISGANSYAGAITLGLMDTRINSDSGTLTLDVASGSAINGAYNLLFGGEGDIVVADPITTTTGTLTKDGGGRLTLAGVNTFTGATSVNGGTLNVNGSLNAASAVAVNAGGALGGTGTCSGPVTASSGGTIAPGVGGTAGGTLTVASMNLSAGSVCAFEVSATPANDKVVVSAASGLTLATGAGVALYNEGTTDAATSLGTYNLIQYAGTLNGSVANLSVINPLADRIYTFVNEGNWIKLNVQAAIVSVLPATNVTPTGARMNGLVVNAGAENPSVFFCWDTSDKGTASTSSWAHVELAGFWGTGQAFSNDVSGLVSGGNYAYRCYAVNSVGAEWSPSAATFRTIFLPSVTNTGSLAVGPGVQQLRGTVTETGGEAPQVWFLYWTGTTTNTVGVGAQSGACSTNAAVLLGSSYNYMLMASNSAGVVYSGVKGFVSATTYHVATSGLDTGANDGLSWSQPFQSIGYALTRTSDGDLVLVSNGVYSITAQIAVTKGVTIRSVNGAVKTFIHRGSGDFRLVLLKHADAVFDGFTISKSTRGGVYIDAAGTLINCVVSNNVSDNLSVSYGGGIWLEKGGLVKNCRIINNTLKTSAGGGASGGGIYFNAGGLVDSCIISNNLVYDGSGGTGGGVHMVGGRIRNSLISQNRHVANVGGIYCNGGVIESCTIVDNHCPTVLGVGGLYCSNGTVLNSIVAYNTHVNGIHNYVNVGAWSYTRSCTTPAVTGTGNTALDPQFRDRATKDYRLLPGPCVDNGANQGWMDSSSTDLSGTPRIRNGTVDMGAYEYTAGALACSFEGTPLTAFMSNTVVFTAYAHGLNTTGLYYQWSFDNGAGYDIEGPGRAMVTNLYWPGLYSVRLVVTNAVGEIATEVRDNYIRVGPAIAYVATNAASMQPYSSWATAATNIQDAINAGVDGTLVLVSNGVYRITRQIDLLQNITVRSVGGAGRTEIRRSSGNARIFYLTRPEAVIDGFTLVNANLGGVYLDTGGVVSNCIIRDNITLNNTTSGGGVRLQGGGVVKNCQIFNNFVNTSGGAGADGGGIAMYSAGLVENCIISNNTVSYGSANQGGGVYLSGGRIRNCLIYRNTHIATAGGVYCSGGIVENCTITSNRCTKVTDAVGGLQSINGTIRNSIIQFNRSASGIFNYLNTGSTRYDNCNTYPTNGVTGSGNTDGDPLFRDLARGNLALRAGSPCINAGLYQSWMDGTFDLAGQPRILNKLVDIGAYENRLPGGTLMMLR